LGSLGFLGFLGYSGYLGYLTFKGSTNSGKPIEDTGKPECTTN
jgi:hypothetical protein